MNDTTDPLAELKIALDALSPHDLAAWAEGVESRLTERLRRRQENGHIPHPDGASAPPGPTTNEE